MFDFLLTKNAKMRSNAKQWLEMAERIHDFRRDLLSPAQLQKLQAERTSLRQLVKQKADAVSVKGGIERLEGAMRECGGRMYPANSWVENVEFFLVAAIVILGLRAYFVQPFKIPTNSMWPSYYGMTSEVFRQGEEPDLLRRAGRLVGLGALNYNATAPADGEVLIPVFRSGMPAFSERPGRSMLIFPTMLRSYPFMVGGREVRVEVPAEFDYSGVLESVFGEPVSGLRLAPGGGLLKNGQPLETSILRVQNGAQPVDERVYWVPTGKTVRQGEKIVSFDILTGDLLFVERVSYNFVQPKIGSGFVFRTENIDSVEMQDAAGRQIRQYYVKRLVGAPGDTLEVRAPALYRNGEPITGSPAFDRNARREGLYPGYVNTGFLRAGEILTVPEHNYFAMGDNSPRSKDSRSWGFVPEKDVVGRPLFIYYPLTKRWGPAH